MDIALLIQVCILIVQLQRHVLAELLAELVIRIPIPAIVTVVQVGLVLLAQMDTLVLNPRHVLAEQLTEHVMYAVTQVISTHVLVLDILEVVVLLVVENTNLVVVLAVMLGMVVVV